MNDGCRNRRYACAIAFGEKFEHNTRMIIKTVWQEEKDFTLVVLVKKEKNLMFQMRTCLRPRIKYQEKL